MPASKTKHNETLHMQYWRGIIEALHCTAGQLVAMYALIRHFVQTNVAIDDERLRAKMESFLLACKAIDLIMSVKNAGLSAADASQELGRVLSKHLEKFVACYGKEAVKPKHHWELHHPEFLSRDGYLLDCWVVERLHRRAKGTLGPNLFV